MNHSKLSRKYNNYGGNNTINLQHMLDNETTETNSVSLTEMVNNLGKEPNQPVAVNNLTEKDFERIIKGGKLNAHHLKSWALFPELRFEISNGITLCVICHRKEHKKCQL